MITAIKEECLCTFPNTYTCGISMTENASNTQKKNKSIYRIVVFMIAALPCSNNKDITNKVWKNTMYEKVKSYKPNVLKRMTIMTPMVHAFCLSINLSMV